MATRDDTFFLTVPVKRFLSSMTISSSIPSNISSRGATVLPHNHVILASGCIFRMASIMGSAITTSPIAAILIIRIFKFVVSYDIRTSIMPATVKQ
jgi:hypothetical protein